MNGTTTTYKRSKDSTRLSTIDSSRSQAQGERKINPERSVACDGAACGTTGCDPGSNPCSRHCPGYSRLLADRVPRPIPCQDVVQGSHHSLVFPRASKGLGTLGVLSIDAVLEMLIRTNNRQHAYADPPNTSAVHRSFFCHTGSVVSNSTTVEGLLAMASWQQGISVTGLAVDASTCIFFSVSHKGP